MNSAIRDASTAVVFLALVFFISAIIPAILGLRGELLWILAGTLTAILYAVGGYAYMRWRQRS